MTTIKSAHRWL